MSDTLTPSQEEAALVSAIFAHARSHEGAPQEDAAVLTGDVAVRIFKGSNLTPEVLGTIWSIADSDTNGWLSKHELSVAVRLIGWAQRGVNVTPELVYKRGPLAIIEGVRNAEAGPSSSSPASSTSQTIPQFTSSDMIKFQRIFSNSGPFNGLLGGDKARDLFSKSGLPFEKLSAIWDLADTHKRGALDLTDFCIAMHLVQALMNKLISVVPPVLPQSLYEQITHECASRLENLSDPLSSPRSPYKGKEAEYFPLRRPVVPFVDVDDSHTDHWDVRSADKENADRLFESLDPKRQGYIESDVAVAFMFETKLPFKDLAHVWSLADINNDGHLTRDGLAILLHLIRQRLSGGEIPETLPVSLLPPSMRTGERSPRNGLLSPLDATGSHRRSVSHSQSPIFYPPLPPSPLSPNGDLSPPLSNLKRPSSMGFIPNFPGNGLSSPTCEACSKKDSDYRAALLESQRQFKEMEQSAKQLRAINLEQKTLIQDLTRENEDLQRELLSSADELKSQKLVHKVIGRENGTLREQTLDLQKSLTSLQNSSTNTEMQRLHLEDVTRENERLTQQVREMRESTTQLPSTGGDGELQMLISEDLARENSRLRSELRETQEAVAQLQTSSVDADAQKSINEELRRENQRQRREMREMREARLQSPSRDEELRRKVADLTRENERLQGQIRTLGSSSASLDVPPPAYHEFASPL